MPVCAWVERNTCGIPRRRHSHLCQTSDTWKILDTDHEIGGDQERRSSQSTSTSNFPGIRVPKCTRWRPKRIHIETDKNVDECLDIVQLQYAKAVITPLTEQKSLNLHDEMTACDQVQHSLFRAVFGKLHTLLEWDQIWCLRQNACHKNLRHQHLQIWHVPRKCWDTWEEHLNWISIWRYLHWNRMTWTRPWNTSRDILTLTGLVIQLRGKAHLAHCVTLINFSWQVNVEDRGLLPCPVENQKCMLLVHCQPSWFSNKLYWKRLDCHSWYTREQTAAQHAQWQRNKERVARWNRFTRDSYSFKILVFRKLLTMSRLKVGSPNSWSLPNNLLYHLPLGTWIHHLFGLSTLLSRWFFEEKILMHPIYQLLNVWDPNFSFPNSHRNRFIPKKDTK